MRCPLPRLSSSNSTSIISLSNVKSLPLLKEGEYRQEGPKCINRKYSDLHFNANTVLCQSILTVSQLSEIYIAYGRNSGRISGHILLTA
jgi:hypothetical protein